MSMLTGLALATVVGAAGFAPQDVLEKGRIRWSTNLTASIEKGKREGKVVIIYFWAPW